MSERLKNKVAIVTGAGSSGPGWGNGKATAVLFAREGAKIFAVDINLDAAEETKAIIDREGGECTTMKVDVSKSDDVKNMVLQCVETYGKIDILHNNVGIAKTEGIDETSEEDWDHISDVNLKSIFLTCKNVIPQMLKQERGAIVNTGSIAGIRGLNVPALVYSTTKAAMIQFTQNIALQYAKNKIRANCILPGFLNTPIIVEPLKQHFGNVEEMVKVRDALVPMGKMGDAWDTAYAALYLASDEAKFVTGTQLVVDGGMSCKCT
jgi:NAD(P)-dependent dehydrogenase (short-subunit alcohol dehydrogenase family)